MSRQGNETARDVAKLFIEKTLQQMYPRLRHTDFPGARHLRGPLIPNFLTWNTAPDTRRIVEIGCGDGVFSNILSLLFPDVEIIGIDPDPDKIAYARTTVSFRQNLKFICGYAGSMNEIPCDRIIYNNCLSTSKNPATFKKLILKTVPWLVAEGDFWVKESPLRLLLNPAFWDTLRSDTLKGPTYLPQKLLSDIGYSQPYIFQTEGLFGLPSTVFYHSYPVASVLEPMFQPVLPPSSAGTALDVLFPNGQANAQWEFA